MKSFITILIVLFSLFSFAQIKDLGWMLVTDNTIPLDKQQHGFAGFALSSLTYNVAYGITGENRKKSKIIAIGLGVLAVVTKEVIDIPKTGFDWQDFSYGTGGVIIGAYTFDLIIHRAKKRNAKRDKIIALTNQHYEKILE